MLEGFIPHSGSSQIKVTRSVALVILTDLPLATSLTSGALRYANHTRLSSVCDDLVWFGEERLGLYGYL
jgi:hypothetical protein